MKKKIIVICWCICMNSVLLWGADDSGFIEKMGLKKTTVEGSTIYYEVCFEEKLPIFIKEYKEYAKTTAESKAQKQAPMHRLKSLEKEITDDITDMVGGDDDLKVSLKKFFDVSVKASPSTTNLLATRGNVFYFVLQSTSKDYLRTGGKLPNLSYDKKTDMADYKLEFRSKSNNAQEQSEILLPFSSAEKFEVEIQEMFSALSELRKTTVLFEYLNIHEIAELAIVRQMRSGDPYKRWFTDGFANVIVHDVLVRHYSPEDAETFLAAYSTEPYKEFENQLNLGYWMSGEFIFTNTDVSLEKENKFNLARYSFATQEAKRLADAYGIKIIKKMLTQYKNLEDKNADSLYSVIQKITGEDLRKRFEKYQNFQTREEGYAQYERQYEQAKQERNAEAMIFSMLRMLELCEQPLSQNSLDLRQKIATLFYLTGEKKLANQYVTEFADLMIQSKNPQNKYAGRAFVSYYALRNNQPEVAYDYAQQTFEENPEEIYAMTVVMHKFLKENDMQKAGELARKICKLEPGEKHPCHQIAKQVLSEIGKK